MARLDQLARNEDLQAKLCLTQWDLVVDEAHKRSATYFGKKLDKTKRFPMTATPHNGKEVGFQLFLFLLDADRVYGRPGDGVHTVDVADVIRRMVKEELLTINGTPLFPERRAYTMNYKLSDLEAALYTEWSSGTLGPCRGHGLTFSGMLELCQRPLAPRSGRGLTAHLCR